MGDSAHEPIKPHAKPRSRTRGVLVGFAIGAAPPVAFGAFALAYDFACQASLPKLPNTAGCGTGMFVELMIIVFGGPICGAIGAALGSMRSSR